MDQRESSLQAPSLADELQTTADLALLELSDSDRAELEAGVKLLLDHFELMSQIDVSELPPTTHALTEENRVRADEERGQENDTPLSDELLEQAPDLEDRFFAIPNVL